MRSTAADIASAGLGHRIVRNEEFGDDGMLRSFAFGYQPLAKTYAPPCRISLPSADQWEAGTPAWLHGRRDEILLRLEDWAQRGYGEAVTLVSYPSRDG